jgi:hypothetical protein
MEKETQQVIANAMQNAIVQNIVFCLCHIEEEDT